VKVELGRFLGITGTPGTGKKSVSAFAAKDLGIRAVSVRDIARAFGLAKAAKGEDVVDTGSLRDRLRGGAGERLLLYGHLLPHVLPRGAALKVVVLRTDPLVLRGRLMERGYPRRKVLDNVESELIGLVSSEAYRAFGAKKTSEVDTTGIAPSEASRQVLEAFRGRGTPQPRKDWTRNYDSGQKLRLLLSEGSGTSAFT
jgi:adenylate kinase